MLNQIILMGRLTRDPERKNSPTGHAIVNFSIAVERDTKSQAGEKETDFIDCVAWRQTAEFIGKYFTKGRMIVVSGRLQIRPWTDKDGNKRRTAEVLVNNAYFGDSKRDADSAAPAQPSGGNSYGGYAQPAGVGVSPGASDFALLDDDDAQLPF